MNKTQLVLANPKSLQVQTLSVQAIAGPDKGKQWQVHCEPIRLGTSEDCDVALCDPTVSHFHAQLERTSKGLWVKDLGSTNGTAINHVHILSGYLFAEQSQTSATLRLGDTELKLTPQNTHQPMDVASQESLGDMVGCSVAMRATFARLKRASQNQATVLLGGETGTGKELAADALHRMGVRAAGPFVVVDCGALPANLLESSLFGHEKGAFTGAHQRQAGAFERAHGGTLFLDEIGELPLSMQPALLGALERRQILRVGGSAPVPIDVRVVAATHRDLAHAVAEGTFRADLYYRLAVVSIHMPPLRKRPEDIPLLAERFLAGLDAQGGDLLSASAILQPQTLKELQRHPWPGNVRELRNLVESAALMNEMPTPASSKHLPATPKSASANQAPDPHLPFKSQKAQLVADFEAAYIHALMLSCEGNISQAARQAQVDRMTLYKLLGRYPEAAAT